MSWINPDGYEIVLDKSGSGIVFAGDTYIFRLLDPPLQWLCDNGRIIEPCRKSLTTVAPDGFKTDLGSVPFPASLLVSRTRYRRAYAFHDVAYRWAGWWGINAIDETAYRIACTRTEADEMLYRMCLADGAGRWTALAIWAGVRVAGWRAWAEYRKADKGAE